MKKKIEILAPAKNLWQGQMAINAGADAVYIGAPSYGARSNATNSVEDIAALVRYAHLFKAQVFVVINTILYDHELEDCRKLIYELYDIGVDALIVQDMAILEMELPPIVLHASTQANNRDPHHVKFLHDAGMQRVVLAREHVGRVRHLDRRVEDLEDAARGDQRLLHAVHDGGQLVDLSGKLLEQAGEDDEARAERQAALDHQPAPVA